MLWQLALRFAHALIFPRCQDPRRWQAQVIRPHAPLLQYSLADIGNVRKAENDES